MNLVFDRIADDLSNKGYAIIDAFLSPGEVKDILSSGFVSLDPFKKAGIGKSMEHQVIDEVRGDHIHWIHYETAPAPVKLYMDRMRALISYLNEALFLSLKDIEAHLTVYPPGKGYQRHLDQFKNDDHRKLSAICYLNAGWAEGHGGQLRMYPENEMLDVLPLEGRLVCFRSDLIEHEVLPATRERLSITGWVLDQWPELRHL